MTTMTVDQLVEDYLDQLEEELADIPRARRRELVNEIAQHIAEAREEAASEADVRTLLDRLGEPAEIAAAARERLDVPAQPSRGVGWEIAALVLLLPGSVIPVVGWFAGAVLLWTSKLWTWGDKIVGTLLVPGGLFTTLLFLGGAIESTGCVGVIDSTGYSSETCADAGSSLGDAVLGVLFWVALIGPFVSTAYLAWRLKRARA